MRSGLKRPKGVVCAGHQRMGLRLIVKGAEALMKQVQCLLASP